MNHEKNNKEKYEEDIKTEPIFENHEPTFVFNPKEVHDWHQRGPYIFCKSCEIEHASYIGMEKLLIGINKEGQPILKRRTT